MADIEEDEKTIAEDLVVTKYKMAGDIVNRVLKQVLARCESEASARELCIFGDQLLIEETSKVFKREKDLKKGIAFPTCISVNNCICHFSPLYSEPDYLLQDSDLVKIELGAHVDGFIALVAHTIVVGASEKNIVTGRKADVVMAAHFASQVALRLIKAGEETYTITDTVKKVAESYDCKPVEGMRSHQIKQFKIEGDKTIVQNPNEMQKKDVENFEFQMFEVYAMDIIMSTGDGVGRESTTRVSVYKKTEETYQLKLRASRIFYSEVAHKYGMMPFNLRNFEDEKKVKLGANECVNHELIEPYQVLYEKSNEFVAQFKFTVLLMPNGPHKITGLPFESHLYHSDFTVSDPQLKTLLNTSANPKAVKKKKKKIVKTGEEPFSKAEVEKNQGKDLE